MNTAALSTSSDTKADLWRILRHAVVAAFDLFGDPASIARQGAALRRTHAPLLLWLRQCEALLRRLFYLDAVALALSLPAVRALSPIRRERVRHAHEQDAEDSAKWRVSFRVCASAPSTDARMRGLLREALSGIQAHQLTACLSRAKRVSKARPQAQTGRASSPPGPPPSVSKRLSAPYNHPAPHIRRLARLLQRRASCAKQFRVAPPRRYGNCPLEEEIAVATELAHAIDCDTS